MILGIGLISLATLFPIGLLRLRDAARWSRSATLLETAASDAIARGLLGSHTFSQVDYQNQILHGPNGPFWYRDSNLQPFNPMVQDTASYLGPAFVVNNGIITGLVGANANPFATTPANVASASFPGLPFAYDPLWRYYTVNPSFPQANGPSPNYAPGGYYIGDSGAYEARFGYGLPNLGTSASAHGLQRITNFNRPASPAGVLVMPTSMNVPNIFVSQEDVVWQDPNVNTYTLGGIAGGQPVTTPNPVIPDLSPTVAEAASGISGGAISLDWRYTWMFTGQLASAGNLSVLDGNIVIFENRPFGIGLPTNTSPQVTAGSGLDYEVAGETVVEGVFGYSGNVVGSGGPGSGGPGYGVSGDRTVLLRWPTTLPDPVVRPGDWIADVTYERNQAIVQSRFLNGGVGGVPNWANKGEWDNLPAQRCFWYRVQKSTPPGPDLLVPTSRSMVVYVNQNVQARTLLNQGGLPVYVNAALIAPNVVNVIPQTIFVR